MNLLLHDKNFADIIIRRSVIAKKLIMVAADILQHGFSPFEGLVL